MDLIVDLITPFDAEYKINKLTLFKLIEELLKVNCQEILFFGPAGEGLNIEFEEMYDIFKEIIELYNDKIIPYIFLKFDNIITLERRVKQLNQLKCTIVIELPQIEISDLGLIECLEFIYKRSENDCYLFYNEKKSINKYNILFIEELLKLKNNKGIFIDLIDNNDLLELKKRNSKEMILIDDTKVIFSTQNNFTKILSVNANIYFEKLSELLMLKDFELLEIYQERFKIAYSKPIPIIVKTYFNEYLYDVGKVRLPLKELHYLEYECYLNKYKEK